MSQSAQGSRLIRRVEHPRTVTTLQAQPRISMRHSNSNRAVPLRARSAAGTSARFLWAFRLASVAVAVACYIMGYVAADFFGRDAAALKDTSTDYGESVPPSEAKWTSTGLSTPKDMYIVLSNEYSRDAAAGIAVEYGWEVVAEPYRVTTMRVKNGGSACYHEWVVNGHIQGYGDSVDVMFTTLGVNEVLLRYRRGKGRSSAAATETLGVKVMVRYVRREIRSLTDLDRESFFQAVMIMQRVPMSVGRTLYGADYRDKDHFNRMHLYFGGAQDCDHWHQGPGFVTSHMAMTLEFERSLQAINPRVALPYWDFTLESTFYGAQEWRDSPVFSTDWFGTSSPDNDLHSVATGRFALVRVMTNAIAYSRVTSPYGLLRAPWNADPTPFMTRSHTIYGYDNNLKPSGCAEYSRSASARDWASLSRSLNSLAHGHIHELMGGSWFHDFADTTHHASALSILTFAHAIQAFSKELWRAGFLECPDQCSLDVPAKDCQCKCRPDVYQDAAPYELLRSAGVLDKLFYFSPGHNYSYLTQFEESVTLPGLSVAESLGVYRSLVSTLCSPGHLGDMFQATSTNDVTFWVLHPLQERLWHHVRLSQDDETSASGQWHDWGPHHCYGHNVTDIQPFRRSLFHGRGGVPSSQGRGGGTVDTTGARGSSTGRGARQHKRTHSRSAARSTGREASAGRGGARHGGLLSNGELYALLHPLSPDLPYVYDNLEWAHCRLMGLPVEPREAAS